MSWLSGIAKGAEALLDKVDQTAASALQNDSAQSQSTDIIKVSRNQPVEHKVEHDDVAQINKVPDESIRPISGEI